MPKMLIVTCTITDCHVWAEDEYELLISIIFH